MKKSLSVIFGVLSIALVFGFSTSAQAQVINVPTADASLSRNLTIGSQGADVTTLQNFLISKGYSIGGVATGYFGARTVAALAQYQVKKEFIQ